MDIFIASMVLAVLAQTTFLTINARGSLRARNAVIMDTSALIDGRIVAIARSGLVTARLLVPKSVVSELQYMADRADHDKRERARFGLDMIEALQSLDEVSAEVFDDRKPAEREVDEQLLRLAQSHGARLCTIDYNLNKAARVQGVQVINVNELAHALRIVHLPGEQTVVKIVQRGQEAKQGVGYLDDGTMVVVDDAKNRINEELEIVVTRVLQTAAGKMMFARLADGGRKDQPQEVRKAAPVAKQTGVPAKGERKKGQSSRRKKSHLSPQARAESNLVKLANEGEDK